MTAAAMQRPTATGIPASTDLPGRLGVSDRFFTMPVKYRLDLPESAETRAEGAAE